MNKSFSAPLLAILIISGSPVLAEPKQLPEPNWTRPLAIEAARQIDTRAELGPLFQLARRGENDLLLQELRFVESNRNWPIPAREKILHEFSLGLGDLPAYSVNSTVLAYLYSIDSQTLVPHDDHGLTGIPLFNIQAATAGSVAGWNRQQGWVHSEHLMSTDSGAWLAAFLAVDPNQRKGFADSLEFASAAQLTAIGNAALAAAGPNPPLAAIAARAGLLLGERQLFEQAISVGAGAETTTLLRMAKNEFDATETESIIKHSIEHAESSTASLAIATLAPTILDRQSVASLMLDLLSDHDLGATAALVLSGSDDQRLRKQLASLADHGESLASHRAQLALRMADSGEEEVER